MTGKKPASWVRETSPLRVRPASSRYAEGDGRDRATAGVAGRYSPGGNGTDSPLGGGPSSTSTALEALKTCRDRSISDSSVARTAPTSE